MGNRQGVGRFCTICSKPYIAKQSNYKTCSSKCRVAALKKQRANYYSKNRDTIINRVSNSKKRVTDGTHCLICNKLFFSRRGTKCCSSECRSILNNAANKANYTHKIYVNVCMVCSQRFSSSRKKKTCSAICYQQHKTKYARLRYKTNVQFKIASNLRSRLNHALKSPKKGLAVKHLGCSLEDLITYLESMFQPDMSWKNYGKWHVDHIRPLSLFNLSNLKELKEACHYTNLQPLRAKDNLIKGNRDHQWV